MFEPQLRIKNNNGAPAGPAGQRQGHLVPEGLQLRAGGEGLPGIIAAGRLAHYTHRGGGTVIADRAGEVALAGAALPGLKQEGDLADHPCWEPETGAVGGAALSGAGPAPGGQPQPSGSGAFTLSHAPAFRWRRELRGPSTHPRKPSAPCGTHRRLRGACWKARYQCGP